MKITLTNLRLKLVIVGLLVGLISGLTFSYCGGLGNYPLHYSSGHDYNPNKQCAEGAAQTCTAFLPPDHSILSIFIHPSNYLPGTFFGIGLLTLWHLHKSSNKPLTVMKSLFIVVLCTICFSVAYYGAFLGSLLTAPLILDPVLLVLKPVLNFLGDDNNSKIEAVHSIAVISSIFVSIASVVSCNLLVSGLERLINPEHSMSKWVVSPIGALLAGLMFVPMYTFVAIGKIPVVVTCVFFTVWQGVMMIVVGNSLLKKR